MRSERVFHTGLLHNHSPGSDVRYARDVLAENPEWGICLVQKHRLPL